MQQLLAAAAKMQSQLVEAQEELAEATVEGTAGGGLVTAVVNGQGELVDVTIAPAAIDPADLEESAQTIADLVLAACRDAYRAAEELQQELMGPLAAGIGALGGTGGGSGLPGQAGFPGIPGIPGLPGQPQRRSEPGDDDAGPAGGT
jgi:DNA-binding YbaB/EbfC family protein